MLFHLLSIVTVSRESYETPLRFLGVTQDTLILHAVADTYKCLNKTLSTQHMYTETKIKMSKNLITHSKERCVLLVRVVGIFDCD